MTPETAEQLIARVKRLSEEATPGPWVQGDVLGQCHMQHRHASSVCKYDYEIRADSHKARRCVSIAPKVTFIGWDDYGPVLKTEPDAAFIAAARTYLPRLAKMVEAAREFGGRECRCHELHPDYGGRCSACDFIAELDRLAGGGEGG